MKIYTLLTFCLITFSLSALGQINYVLNPGFEDHTGCPDHVDNIKQANYWQPIDSIDLDPLCSPEFCRACALLPDLGMPGMPFPITRYYHYAHSGFGMSQVQIFFDESLPSQHYHRDYLQGHLSHSLIAGQSYCVSFYVFEYGVYRLNHIGAYLDNGYIDHAQDSTYCAIEQTAYIPQIIEQTVFYDSVIDSLTWHKVEGSFVATGNERFITIGNFSDKAHTNYILSLNPADTAGLAENGTGLSWMLVDDVSVIASNSLPHAGNDTTINQGDSAFIGPHEIALPDYWYVKGHANPVDSGGGVWVHPDTTATYILEQTLCGLTTTDTVKITVIPHEGGNSVQQVGYDKGFVLYPNPATNDFTIKLLTTNGGYTLHLYDVSGRLVQTEILIDNINTVHTDLTPGVYIAEVVDDAGDRYMQRLVVR